LVIAGEESGTLAEWRNSHWTEIALEENSCRGPVGRRHLHRAAARGLQRGVERLARVPGWRAANDDLAAAHEGCEGGGVIVIGPTFEFRPAHAFELRVRKPE